MIVLKIIGWIFLIYLIILAIFKFFDKTYNFRSKLDKYKNPEKYKIVKGSYYRMPIYFGGPMKYKVIINNIDYSNKRIKYDIIYDDIKDSILNKSNQEISLWDFISLYIMKDAVKYENNDLSDIY